MMDLMFCPQCRFRQPVSHVFCIACGIELPGHLVREPPNKRARFFAGTPVAEGDPEGAFLRVSCYLKEQVFESEEGSVTIPGHHVRFSVWVGREAQSVISLPEAEAMDLARFIAVQCKELNHADPLALTD